MVSQSSPIISSYIKKKFSLSSIEWSTSFTMSSSPDSVFQMVHALVRFPRGSYSAYWVFIFQHCFSLAFLQQLYLLPEFNVYVLDRCPYLIQLFAFFFFGLFERSYHCSFEFSVWEMVQIILFEVHYWLGLVNIFVGNIIVLFSLLYNLKSISISTKMSLSNVFLSYYFPFSYFPQILPTCIPANIFCRAFPSFLSLKKEKKKRRKITQEKQT